MARVPIDVTLTTDVSGVPHFDSSDTVTVWSDAALSSSLTVMSAESGGTTMTQPLSLANGGLTASGVVNGYVATPTEIYVHVVGTTTTYHRPGIHSSDLAGSVSLSSTNTWTALNTFSAGAKIGTVKLTSGTGSPAGVVTGSVDDVYIRADGVGGITVYDKVSGTATTSGWVARGSAGRIDISRAPYYCTMDDTGDNTVPLNQALLDASTTGSTIFTPYGSVRCLGEVIYWDNTRIEGIGEQESVWHWPTDLGPGKWGLRGHDPGNAVGFGHGVMSNMSLQGPDFGVTGSTGGIHRSYMNGMAVLSQMVLYHVNSSGFENGFTIDGTHTYLDFCGAGFNYIGVMWLPSSAGWGAHWFTNCQIVGNSFACFGADGAARLAGVVITGGDCSLSPYGLYKFDTLSRKAFNIVTNGTTLVTSVNGSPDSANFAAGDVGKSVDIDGFQTTISAVGTVSGGTSATLAAIPVMGGTMDAHNRTGVTMFLGTPNSVGFCTGWVMRDSSFETVGNGAIFDGSTGTNSLFGSSEFVKVGHSFNDLATSVIITRRARDWAVKLRNMASFVCRNNVEHFTTGLVGTYWADSGDFFFDNDASINDAGFMFGSGGVWAPVSASYTSPQWQGRLSTALSTIGANEFIEYPANFGGVQRFGVATRRSAGVSMNAAVTNQPIWIAEPPSPQVPLLAEVVSKQGCAIIPYPTTPYHGVVAAGDPNGSGSTLAVYPTSDPILAYKEAYQGPGGAAGGGIIYVRLVTPTPQQNYVSSFLVTSLPTASATYYLQRLTLAGNYSTTADHDYICKRDATGAYVWAQTDN